MTDENALAMGRIVGEVLRDIIVQANFPLFDKLHHGGRRELLRDRANAVHRHRGRRHVVLEVR